MKSQQFFNNNRTLLLPRYIRCFPHFSPFWFNTQKCASFKTACFIIIRIDRPGTSQKLLLGCNFQIVNACTILKCNILTHFSWLCTLKNAKILVWFCSYRQKGSTEEITSQYFCAFIFPPCGNLALTPQ